MITDKLIFLLFILQGILVSSQNMQENIKFFRLDQTEIFVTPIFLESCDYIASIVENQQPNAEVISVLKEAFKKGSYFSEFYYKGNYFRSCKILLPSFCPDKYDDVEKICVKQAQIFIQQNKDKNFSTKSYMSIVIWLANHLLFEGKENISSDLVLEIIKMALNVFEVLNEESLETDKVEFLDADTKLSCEVTKARRLWQTYQCYLKDNYQKNCKRLVHWCSEALLKNAERFLTSDIEEIAALENVAKYAKLCANTTGYEKDWFLAEAPFSSMPPAILAWSSLRAWYANNNIHYCKLLLNVEKALNHNHPNKPILCNYLNSLVRFDLYFELLNQNNYFLNKLQQDSVQETIIKERDNIKNEQAENITNLLQFFINEEERLWRDNIETDCIQERSTLIKQAETERAWDSLCAIETDYSLHPKYEVELEENCLIKPKKIFSRVIRWLLYLMPVFAVQP